MRAQELITTLVRNPDSAVRMRTGEVVVGFEVRGADVVLEAVSSEPYPETAGTWSDRCAALYQVIGAMAERAGVDATDALDVASGRGDVARLLPFPKKAPIPEWERPE